MWSQNSFHRSFHLLISFFYYKYILLSFFSCLGLCGFCIETFSTRVYCSEQLMCKKLNKTLKIIIIFTTIDLVLFKKIKNNNLKKQACRHRQLTLSFYCWDPWHWNLINNQEAIIQMWNLIHQISNKQTKQEACINDCLALYIKTSLHCNIQFRNNEGKTAMNERYARMDLFSSLSKLISS